ncbi:ATP-binding protein [Micromonospora sp. NPDC051196]
MPGSALGPAITQHLVKAHGGTLTAQSAIDEGTVFTITLPTTT